MKNIVHIDLNAFFVQVEELKDPSIVGKIVAVGGKNGRGVISTANYAARKLGIHSGMASKEALQICKELVLIEGHYHDYENYSNRFFNYLRRKYPLLEQTSIDECYIDMSDLFTHEEAHDYLRDLQIELFKATDLKCSIGVGDTRFLAKMASDYQKPLGCTIIYRENIKEVLWPIKIDDMYGIGKKTCPRLKSLGINTIGDLAITQDPAVKRLLGSMFIDYQSHANGYGADTISTAEHDPKSISSARTFEDDTSDYEQLTGMIIHLTKGIVKELKSYDKMANTVFITFRNSEFQTWSKRIKFDTYSDDDKTLISRALQTFEKYYDEQPLRLIGVGFADIKDKENIEEQLSLLSKNTIGEEKKTNTNDIIEQFNSKNPKIKLVKASSLSKNTEKKEKRRPHQRFHVPEVNER